MFRREDPTIFRKHEHIFVYNPPNVDREDYDPIRREYFDEFGRTVKALDANSEFGSLLLKIKMAQDMNNDAIVQKITKKLRKKENLLGGKHEAHSKEVCTSALIQIVLDTVLNWRFDIRDFSVKPEEVINLFEKPIRPDFIVYRNNNARATRTPLLVIEIKRTL